MLLFQKLASLLRLLFCPQTKFLSVFPIAWLLSCVILTAVDLGTKKWITSYLNFNLSPGQLHYVDVRKENFQGKNQVKDLIDTSGAEQINILGQEGKHIKFRLLFNNRFIFGIGPSRPILGFFLTLISALFLLLYRWHNPMLGHKVAWLLVFSGALGNLIDKLFLKSLVEREWHLSLIPKQGYVGGVVDFIECTWFGWTKAQDYFLLHFLSMETWPTFNVADSMITVGIVILFFTMKTENLSTKKGK